MSNDERNLWNEFRDLIAWELVSLALKIMPGAAKIELVALIHPLLKVNVEKIKVQMQRKYWRPNDRE